MTAAQLQSLIERMGCVRTGAGVCARCPVHQPIETDAEGYKLRVGPGASYPIVTFCPACQIAKPQTDEDREFNRLVNVQVWKGFGIQLEEVLDRMDAGDIRRLWATIRVRGQLLVQPDTNRADDDVLDRAYRRLLDGLTLADRHKKWLTKKGLDPDWCASVGYRSSGGPCRTDDQSVGVPGLIDGSWWTRSGALLVPCRDRTGRIGAVKQRLTNGGKARMRLVGGGECKAKVLLHHPVGSVVSRELDLIVVEGERKADFMISVLHKPSVVALPGVGSWSRAVEWGTLARSVTLALDMDDAGRKHTELLGRALVEKGVTVTLMEWQKGKGPDDACLLGEAFVYTDWEDRDGQNLIANLPTKKVSTVVPFTKGQRLRDTQIVEYLKYMGPTLRHEMNAYSIKVSELIRKGEVKMTVTKQGQLLEVPDSE